MSREKALQGKWKHQEDQRKAPQDLEPDMELAQAISAVRVAAGLSQVQLAQKMQTTQSVIERLEGSKTMPSTQTLQKLAAATGTRLKISFEPAE
jgi:ribosome-binding protein aMBF1 (putative translation factor)